jgi:hypothetical protein
MIEQAKYIMLDTSQYVYLMKEKNISILNTPCFLKKYGFPFITSNHIWELGSIKDYDVFCERLNMLESISTFYTLQSYDNQLTGNITDLLLLELKIKSNNINVDINNIREAFFNSIVNKKIIIPSNQRKQIFEICKSQTTKTSLISTLNSNDLNPFFHKKLKEIKSFIINLDDNKQKIGGFVNQYNDYLKSRVSRDKDYNNILSLLNDKLIELWNNSKNGITVGEYFYNLMGDDINDEYTIQEITTLNEFRLLKLLSSERLKIPYENVKDIKIDNTIINYLHYKTRIMLDNELLKDKKRHIETGNINDIYFLLFSVFIKVFVDKRTLNFTANLEKIIKNLGITSLNIEKIQANYNCA